MLIGDLRQHNFPVVRREGAALTGKARHSLLTILFEK